MRNKAVIDHGRRSQIENSGELRGIFRMAKQQAAVLQYGAAAAALGAAHDFVIAKNDVAGISATEAKERSFRGGIFGAPRRRGRNSASGKCGNNLLVHQVVD